MEMSLFMALCVLGFCSVLSDVQGSLFTMKYQEALLDKNFSLGQPCSGIAGCSLLHCAGLCTNAKECKSVSYNVPGKRCVLYNIQASNSVASASKVMDAGWRTFEKTEDWSDRNTATDGGDQALAAPATAQTTSTTTNPAQPTNADEGVTTTSTSANQADGDTSAASYTSTIANRNVEPSGTSQAVTIRTSTSADQTAHTTSTTVNQVDAETIAYSSGDLLSGESGVRGGVNEGSEQASHGSTGQSVTEQVAYSSVAQAPATSTTTDAANAAKPRDCKDILGAEGESKTGVYTIYPSGYPSGIQIRCALKNGNPWTIIDRRQNATESFQKSLEEYKVGFGSVEGSYWIGWCVSTLKTHSHCTTCIGLYSRGTFPMDASRPTRNPYTPGRSWNACDCLDIIYALTSSATYELSVLVEATDGVTYTATYSNFSVGPSPDYRLQYAEFLGGNAGDGLVQFKGQYFWGRGDCNDCIGWWVEEISGCCSDTPHQPMNGEALWSSSKGDFALEKFWMRIKRP